MRSTRHTAEHSAGDSCLLLIVLLCLLFVANGCSPRIVENIQTRVEYRDRTVRDSIYFRDSIYVKEVVKGDTVYVMKYIDRWRYIDKSVHDTTYVAVHDTTVVEKEIEKRLTPIQEMKQNSWSWLVVALFGLLVWTFRKPFIGLLKKLILK